MILAAVVDLSALVVLWDRLAADTVLGGIGSELERVTEYVASQAPAVAPRPSSGTSRVVGGGGHSDAWWQGVAMCEQGGRNHPYYGFFSYMDGSAAGMSWEQQVAKGNATLSQYPERLSQGGAWADSCVDAGYRASPNG